METVSDPIGREVSLEYNANGNLVKITDADGYPTEYSYNDNNQIEKAEAIIGENRQQIFKNSFDEEGRISEQDDGRTDNLPIRLTYDEESELGKIITTVTDRNGHTRVFTYDENYQMLSMKDELGNMSAVYTYDNSGNRNSAADANTHKTSFEYDSNGDMIRVTDAADNTTIMTYENRNLISLKNADGKTTSFAYDENNNLETSTDLKSNVTRYGYNANGQPATVTGPDGKVTTYEYEQGLPVRMKDPEANIWKFAYDGAGRLTSFADPKDNTYTISYSDASCGGACRLGTVTDPLGNIIRMSYDYRGNLVSFTDARGNITLYAYDGNGNLVSQTDALNHETRYEYDGEDRVTRIINARGYAAQLVYDAKGRLIRVTDALGHKQEIAYDNTYNVRSQADALGKTVMSSDYDKLDNLTSVTDVLGNKTGFDYDALSRLTKTTDPLNRVTQFSYNDLNELISVTDARQGTSTQEFDQDGNLTAITDPGNNQTKFSFNKNGRLITETSAAGNSVHYTYNESDLLAQVRNAREQSRTFEYDEAGRIKSLTDPDGTVSYTYDANGNVLTVTDKNGVITREYDKLNRVIRYTDVQGNTLEYVYDAVGNLTALVYPDKKTVQYEYDQADRLIKVTDWAARETRYEYDANDRLTRTVRPNGTVMTHLYNDAGQLVQQKDATSQGEVIAQYDFTYDKAGNITDEKVTPKPEPFPFMPIRMTYGKANQLATYNDESVTYDADGNMTRGPLGGTMADFVFDSRNRLVSAGTSAYTYDAEDHRIAVTEDGIQTRYVINPHASLSQVLIRTEADGTQTFYVYGLGLIGEEQGGAYRAYHFDLRGSSVALTDESGSIVDRFQYTPYCGLVNHASSTTTPFLYNGRDGVMTDSNGLYYMRSRYYNFEVRRFINQDVLLGNLADGRTLNRYVYVNGEPTKYTDPFGLSARNFWINTIDRIRQFSRNSQNISYVQKTLMYSGTVFGNQLLSYAGRITNRRNITDATNYVLGYVPTWDPVSNTRIESLNPTIQRSVRTLINNDELRGRYLRVTDGFRSHKQQNDLYAQGRTTKGKIVTYAKGGESYHNYGRAIDIVEMVNGATNYNADIRGTSQIAERMGFEWGGRWKFVDGPHFQMTNGLTIKDLQKQCAD